MKKIISALIVFAMLCTALIAAIPASAATIDDSELKSLIKEVEELFEEDYEERSWRSLSTALAAAKTALSSAANQAEIDKAKDTLKREKEDLDHIPVSLEMLGEKIDDVETLVEKLVETEFTADNWQALRTALAAAKTAYDEDIDQNSKIADEYWALMDAFRVIKGELLEMLKKLMEDADRINNENDYAKKHNKQVGDYTVDTWALFETAYATAKENVESDDAEKFNASKVELTAAIKALVPIAVPDAAKQKVAELLDLADVLIPTDWSDSAWGMVELKVKQAKDAAKDPRVSVYLRAGNELETALKNLTNKDKTSKEVLPVRPVVDVAYLVELIEHVKTLKEADYTPESWKSLANALKEAELIVDNPRKAERVRATYEKLNKLRKDLVAVTPDPDESNSEDADNGADDEAGGCGGFVATTAVVMTSVLALGAAVVVKKKED